MILERKQLKKTAWIGILPIVLLLSSCTDKFEELSLVDNNDTILAISDVNGSVIALGLRRYYLLKGRLPVIIKEDIKRLKPGTCYDLKEQKIYKFSIRDFIGRYSKQFPELTQIRGIKNGL